MIIRLAPWTSLLSCLGRRSRRCTVLQGCQCRSWLMMDPGWRFHVRGQVPFVAILRLLPWLRTLATPDKLEQRLRFYAHQIKSFRTTSVMYFSPVLMERIRQMESDYERAVRQFYCRPPPSSPGLQSSATAEQPTPGLQGAVATEQPTPGLQGAAATEQPTPGLQGAAATEQPTPGLQGAAAEQPTPGLQPDTPQHDTPQPDTPQRDPKSALTSSTRRRGRPSAQVTEGPADASAAAQVTEGLVDASAPTQATEGLGDASAPAHVTEGLGNASAPAHVTEGPADTSAPAHVTEGLADASAPAHVTEGMVDASSPASGLKVFQEFSESLVLVLVPESPDEGLLPVSTPSPTTAQDSVLQFLAPA
ncbi:hypothetical protein CRENBAI_002266 [Crenichthys baileyi]|uniref:Uncharacterized protein n=1 Tax=Crenichthys baileyi TaxID=28760 RepID=A0AAV9SFH8_9TELE